MPHFYMSLIIVEIYNPPSFKLKYFNNNLEKILNKIEKEKKYVFYNVNNMQMQEFSNIFTTFYYHILINLPTRERNQSTTLLDNIIPDCYDTGTSGILKFLTQSDHYSIFTTRKSKALPKSIEHIKKRIHNNKNISKFKKSLVKINWTTLGLFREESLSSTFSLFMNTVLHNYQTCFPIEIIKLKYTNINPWITQELKNVIKIRDRLYKKRKKKPTTENISNYKGYKNENLSKQRKAERDYYRE